MRSFTTAFIGRVALASTAVIAGTAADAQLLPPLGQTLSTVTAGSSSGEEQRTVTQRWGNITPFWGNITPFWGNITPFWGNITPFWGNITPFSGDVRQFWGNITPFMDQSLPAGTVVPQWGNITPFWGEVGQMWGNITPFWGTLGAYQQNQQGYANVAGQLRQMVARSESFWAPIIQSRTGQSFDEGFAAAMLAKHGIDLNRPETLQLTRQQQGAFMLDWYDGLMNFSGTDRVDHWMKTVNWTPALTTIQGSGTDAVVGLLDSTVVNDPGIRDNITAYYGYTDVSNGHGAAVASLIVAPHDGRGVMGIAPNARVVSYNPFDASGTASWTDIANGVQKLSESGARIINMSLGVPGYTFHPEWNGVFQRLSTILNAQKSVFVIAAGNDGITQTQNVAWNFATNPEFLIVGSVDVNGNISSFSNRPGSACLLDVTTCRGGNRLRDRFIVAPGELMLASDDNGGVMRVSGTSFAAPLVSGAIALLHDRWPWMANYPKETVDVIVKSARDLGPKGVDDTYGVGLLDVTASQSPLNLDKLGWYEPTSNGSFRQVEAKYVRDASYSLQSNWEAKAAYFYAYETIGGTYRDFAIPMSTKLVGLSATMYGGSRERFQTYLQGRLQDWMKNSYDPTAGNSGSGHSFSGFRSFAALGAGVPNRAGVNATFYVAPRTRIAGYRQSAMPYQTSLKLASPDERMALQFGVGDGAVTLAGQDGFALVSDYDTVSGGANPLLGMASGGGYLNLSTRLARGLKVAFGVTQRDLRRDLRGVALIDQVTFGGIDDYRAAAQSVSLSYSAAPWLTLGASYTRVRESSALLGMQSLDRNDFRGGAATRGTTLSADVDVGSGLRVATTATFGRTTAGRAGDPGFSVSGAGIRSSAFQVAVTKNHVLDRHDRLRATLAQPMHVDGGKISYTGLEVVNRRTGSIGLVTRSFDLEPGKRPYVAEVIYGRLLPAGIGEVSLFGRANLRPQADPGTSLNLGAAYMTGARLTLDF